MSAPLPNETTDLENLAAFAAALDLDSDGLGEASLVASIAARLGIRHADPEPAVRASVELWLARQEWLRGA